MPPILFKPKEKVDAAANNQVLRYKVLPRIRANHPDGSYAPIRLSKSRSSWRPTLPAFGTETFQPVSSSDLNLLDFYWWSVIGKRSNHVHHSNLDSLRAAITAVWNGIDVAEIRKACFKFRPRLEAGVEENAKHMEQMK